jgi:hypothetical protein
LFWQTFLIATLHFYHLLFGVFGTVFGTLGSIALELLFFIFSELGHLFDGFRMIVKGSFGLIDSPS